MADQTGAGPFAKTLRLLLLIALVVVGVQVYLNKPTARAEVLCYPAYLGYKVLAVDLWELIIPKEHSFHVKMIKHTHRMHDGCVYYAGYIPGFEEAADRHGQQSWSLPTFNDLR